VPTVRCIVERSWTDSLPRDSVVNVLHFATGALDPGGYDELTQELAAAFHDMGIFSSQGHKVKAYDLADAKPRPVKSETLIAPTGPMSATGNRDVALCLSFYATRNLPRQRGRLYLGPFSQTDCGQHRPPGALITTLATMPAKFAAAGGASVEWAVYSEADNTARPVTNWYIDDEWDTQRRRGTKPSARTTGTVTA
jgi:hypothetical protein